jgi:Concanavalin A-like lectin/glucanases superfamily
LFNTEFYTSGGNTRTFGSSVPFSVINQWQLVTVTFNNGSLICYVNGAFSAAASGGSNLINSTSNLIIGGYSNPVSGAYQRNIDDVRLFNRALSASDVATLYAIENAQNNWRQQYFGSTSNSGEVQSNIGPESLN